MSKKNEDTKKSQPAAPAPAAATPPAPQPAAPAPSSADAAPPAPAPAAKEPEAPAPASADGDKQPAPAAATPPAPAKAAPKPAPQPTAKPAAGDESFPTYRNMSKNRLNIRGFTIDKGKERTLDASEMKNKNLQMRLAHAEKNGLVKKV